jgi:hypothetical protein
MHGVRFLRAAAVGLGAVAAGATVVHCSTAWTSSNPINVPDAFPKWDYNWDR